MDTVFVESGTKSVVHKDGTDNMNCLFAGRKRLIMWHPKYEELIESRDFGAFTCW